MIAASLLTIGLYPGQHEPAQHIAAANLPRAAAWDRCRSGTGQGPYFPSHHEFPSIVAREGLESGYYRIRRLARQRSQIPLVSLGQKNGVERYRERKSDPPDAGTKHLVKTPLATRSVSIVAGKFSPAVKLPLNAHACRQHPRTHHLSSIFLPAFRHQILGA